jgi:lysozyme
MKRPDIPQAAVDLVKEFEGCRLQAYLDPVGIPTIGYGLTTGALPGVVVQMGMTITQREADEYLERTLARFADQIWPAFSRYPQPHQFGAMVSLAYNIGTGAFRKSTALKRFNAGDTAGTAEAMLWWNKAGGKVLRGLVRRREAEVALFLGEPDGVAVAETSAKPDSMRENLASSTTIGATAGTAIAGATGAATAISQLDGAAQLVVIGAAVLAGLLLIWIARERLRRWAEGVR